MASDLPLPELFKRAVSALAAVDERWPILEHYMGTGPLVPRRREGPVNTESIESAVNLLKEVSETVFRLALISKNEELEDVSTTSLIYVVVPYLLSRAQSRVQGDGRLHALHEARGDINIFFEKLNMLGILTPAARERLHGEENGSHKRKPVIRAREEKIARFKEEKRAEKAVEQLAGRARSGEDESAQRDAVLLLLASAQRKAEDDLDSIEMEIEVLEFAKRTREKGHDPRVLAQKEREKAPPTVMDGLPPTFRIVNKRDEAKKAVFRPDHSLPTYSIEEWGEIERERAVKAALEQREKDTVKVRMQEEEEYADTDATADRKTMGQRSWDGWRDEHNRGSGNTVR